MKINRLLINEHCGNRYFKVVSGVGKPYVIKVAWIGHYSRKAYDILDLYFKTVENKSAYQYWYDSKYNKDGTAKY